MPPALIQRHLNRTAVFLIPLVGLVSSGLMIWILCIFYGAMMKIRDELRDIKGALRERGLTFKLPTGHPRFNNFSQDPLCLQPWCYFCPTAGGVDDRAAAPRCGLLFEVCMNCAICC